MVHSLLANGNTFKNGTSKYEYNKLAYLESLLLNLTANGTIDLDDVLGRKRDDVFEFRMKLGFYILLFVVALVGNLCVIIVILRTKSLRTNFNVYIVNLAIADLMMPLFCMWVHFVTNMNLDWVLGRFICKIHTFVQTTTVCSSVFTLTTVTLDRYLATIYPQAAWITQKYQKLSIIVIWILSLSFGIPWLVYQFYDEVDWIGGHERVCQTNFPSLTARRAYYISFFLLVFIVPLLLMFTLLVITILKDNKIPRGSLLEIEAYREMRRKAVYMLLTIVVTFCICWAPQHSLILWDVFRDRHKRTFNIREVHYICLYVAYSSSALNPFIYYIYNKCFRHAFVSLIKSGCRGDYSVTTVSPVNDVEINVPATNTNNTNGTNVQHSLKHDQTELPGDEDDNVNSSLSTTQL